MTTEFVTRPEPTKIGRKPNPNSMVAKLRETADNGLAILMPTKNIGGYYALLRKQGYEMHVATRDGMRTAWCTRVNG